MDLTIGDTQAILQECRDRDLTLEQAAYVLATAYWETARTMKPVKEAYWLSENWRKSNLRYYPYYGRGYVQLTWDYNYEYAGKRLGADFVANLDLALNTEYAKQILVLGCKEGWFTGKRLSQYINEDSKDYMNARRVVNGTDRAEKIAAIAKDYEEALKPIYKQDKQFDLVGLLNALMAALKGILNVFK